MLKVNPIKPLRDDETTPGAKCLLLRPGIDASGRDTGLFAPDTMVDDLESTTWSPTISKLVETHVARLRPYDLTLTYDDWTMRK
jgi:hypothetical protein